MKPKALSPYDWRELHAVWFAKAGTPADRMKRWFVADPAFDASLRPFEPWLGKIEGWDATAEGALTAVILHDQIPRNLYRGTAEAFRWDELGYRLAERAIERGFDLAVPPIERGFFYLPFEHHESLESQDRAVRLFEALAASVTDEDEKKLAAIYVDFAHRHRDVVRKFGRFPHRNRALGRTSTAAELEYLAEPGAGF